MALLEIPEIQVNLLFHRILYFVGQVAEEVNACTFLQLVDADGVVGIVLVGITGILVQRPKGNGVIGVRRLVVVQQCHVEVLGYQQTVVALLRIDTIYL